MLDYDFECSILRWVYTYGVWCTASTVQAPRTRRTHCGQHRTGTGNVCAEFWKNKTILILMHGVARCARRRTRSKQAPCSAVQAADSAACTAPAHSVNGAARRLLAVWTVLHGACSQCERCCTAPARSVNGVARRLLAVWTVLHGAWRSVNGAARRLLAVWTVLHGACSQCERCCTAPALSVNGAARRLLAVWTVLHGACSQCERCCTAPARSVNGAASFFVVFL